MKTVYQEAIVAPDNLRHGIRLDSTNKADILALPDSDEHAAGRYHGEAGKLLDIDGGDLESCQTVRRMTGGFIQSWNIGLDQPVSELSQMTVTVPGIVMKRYSMKSSS